MVSECKRSVLEGDWFINENKWKLEADLIVHTEHLAHIKGATAQAVVDKIDESVDGNTSFVWPGEHKYAVYYSDCRATKPIEESKMFKAKKL